MPIYLDITDSAGFRVVAVDQTKFWVGGHKSGCDIELDLPGCASRVLEVHWDGSAIKVRTEPGTELAPRTESGPVGPRFETLLDGDVVNLGQVSLRIRQGKTQDLVELDPATLTDTPGASVGSWYQTLMEVADCLEGVAGADRMIQTAAEAILSTTSADRVLLELGSNYSVNGQNTFFFANGGDRTAFRVSRNLVDQVKETGRVVHVPVSAADPVASRFASVRREGISSSIALPVLALGQTQGVLYVDCIREDVSLSAQDLQRVAFICRLLASALGHRELVSSLVRVSNNDIAAHPALQSQSPRYAECVELVKIYAPTDYTVLIRGETGVGKEVIARAMHDLSKRRRGPFIPVNCAAIPGQLMESVLFGHEKGSFTGAAQSRTGHFEEANGGTLFLDEIGDMALDLQSKILRVLQDHIVNPVGSRRQVRVDVRILAATHQDLEKMSTEGRFRQDLYYRIRELEIRLPALRDRREDIELLCERFIAETSRELGYSRAPQLADATLEYLRQQRWNGNIRELRAVIRAATLRSGGRTIKVEHLDERMETKERIQAGTNESSSTDPSLTWKERLEVQEREALRETLRRANGNLTKGAELFGVPRTTYRERLVKFGLLKSSESSSENLSN